MNNETKVKCEVVNCIHNDYKNCNLKVLNISYTSNSHECHNKKDTICKNFLSR